LTTGNLFCGFLALLLTVQTRYTEAAIAIFVAMVMDLLDGRVARLMKATSQFGVEYDSLADVVSFGVAPAFLMYSFALAKLGRPAWFAAFLFTICGALRLARFNVQRHAVDGRYFVGLPIPAAAGQVAALVLFLPEGLSGRPAALAVMCVVVTLSFLMVSTLRYRSFKGLDLRARRSYIAILGIALLFLLVALHPEWVVLLGASLYSLSAPAAYAAALVSRRRPRPPAQVPAGEAL
jgi:CDP-diacylglycerol--serine O-phosphatidyltransferase